MSQLVPYLNFGFEDSQLLPENDLFYTQDFVDSTKMFIALEGLNSGVPTRTTPTLTPTTLRNIEQTFIELQSKSESHENEAGFVPPLVHSIGNNQYISASDADIYSTSKTPSSVWQPSSLSQSSSDSCSTRPTPPATPQSGAGASSTPPVRRNMGGRKPTKDLNISPEEEERRRVRRERNKAAAARCRKRRVDHTNSLVEQVEELEQTKQAIQNQIQAMQSHKEELEYILQSHRLNSQCVLQNNGSSACANTPNNNNNNSRPLSPPDIKPYVLVSQTDRVKTEALLHHDDHDFSLPPPAKKLMLSATTVPISKPSRPNSLNVAATAPLFPKNNHNQQQQQNGGATVHEIAGISITTPSSGMHFNFDSLMVGGTGLTPVSAPLVPSCSTQQRHLPTSGGGGSGDVISSPDNGAPPKLVSL